MKNVCPPMSRTVFRKNKQLRQTNASMSIWFCNYAKPKICDFSIISVRLQDLENQYRKEKEEADQLLEQHRLVRFTHIKSLY